MRVEKRNGSEARQVLLRMVVDPQVVGPVSARWEKRGMLGSRWENLVGDWAVQHYRKFGKAAGRQIKIYFDRWAEGHRDGDVADAVGTFLESLSDEFRKNGQAVPAPVALDMASRVFDKVKLERVREEIAACIEAGDVEGAKRAHAKFRPAEVATDSALDVLSGGPVVRQAMKDVGKPLVVWDQPAMQKFFTDSLAREEFVIFEGPEKRGKSFILQEVSFQALLNHRRVAFFETGDQSRVQILRRMAARAARRPFRADPHFRYPVSITPADTEGELPQVDYETRPCPEKMTGKQAERALQEWGEKYGRDMLRLSVHPNGSVNVAHIDATIDRWANDGWGPPDAIVIDYMDILAKIEGSGDGRDAINATWMATRGLGQKYHCLMVGATQTDADSYDAVTIGQKNFSEDKRKNAHVTLTVGINQTNKERERGLLRLNFPQGRDLDINPQVGVYMAACLAAANPCVLSCY